MKIVGKPGSLALVRKRAGAQKKPRNLMNIFVTALCTMMLLACTVFYIGAKQGWIHTRWNYDDSEYHYVSAQMRKLDLEIEAMNHEVYEATQRLGVIKDYVNKCSRFVDREGHANFNTFEEE